MVCCANEFQMKDKNSRIPTAEATDQRAGALGCRDSGLLCEVVSDLKEHRSQEIAFMQTNRIE